MHASEAPPWALHVVLKCGQTVYLHCESKPPEFKPGAGPIKIEHCNGETWIVATEVVVWRISKQPIAAASVVGSEAN